MTCMSKATYLFLPALWQQLPVFYQPWWLDITSTHWDIAMAGQQGHVNGVFPYCTDRRMGLSIIRNPLLTPYLGPFFLYPAHATGAAERAVFEEQTLQELWQHIPRWDSFDMETTTAFQREDLLQEKGFHTSTKITYETNLCQPEETLWSAMHKNHRHLIKQAMQTNRVDSGLSFMPELLRLHQQTFTRKDMRYPFPTSMVEKLVRESTSRDCGALFATTDGEGRTTAAIFTVWDNHTMYLLLSVMDPEQAHQGSVRLLIWHAQQQAQARGLQVFDFEGSMDPGIEAFFRRFGGERKTYLCAARNKSVLWKIKKALRG